MPDQLERRYIGTRVGYTLTAVGCYFGTLYVLSQFPALSQPETWSALQWLLATLATATVSDTARPSGMAASPFMKPKTTETP